MLSKTATNISLVVWFNIIRTRILLFITNWFDSSQTVCPMHWIDPVISFFRLSVCLWTDRLSNDYVHNSLPIFTKFPVQLRSVVASTPIVCETNRKQFADFRCADSDFGSFQALVSTFFNRSVPNPMYRLQIKFGNANLVFNGEWNRK